MVVFMKRRSKLFMLLNKNTELKYNDYICGTLLGNIIKNILISIIFLLLIGVYFPFDNVIYVIIYFVIYLGVLILLFRNIINRFTIVGINKKGYVVATFSIFNKMISIDEIPYEKVKYISYEGLIKKINISYIGIDGKLYNKKVSIPLTEKNFESSLKVINKVIEMQKVFDRGDF